RSSLGTPHAVTRLLSELLQATDTFGEAKPGRPPQPAMNLLYGALMQIYDYMVRSLSSFGMLTTGTGEAIVFLYIDWSSDEKTLYYHVERPGEPAADVKGATYDLKEAAFRLAVGQYVTFAPMTNKKCHPTIRFIKDNFKPDGLYVYTNPVKGRRRNALLFPYEVKRLYIVHHTSYMLSLDRQG
ncbi:hypothetical protein E4U11_007300, partial [Claviceps purpurea]